MAGPRWGPWSPPGLRPPQSGGDWAANTGNGFSGGLQFTPSTWAAFGGTQYAASADQASQGRQIAVTENVLAAQGPGARPTCGATAGLTAGGSPATVDTTSTAGTTPSSNTTSGGAADAPAAPATTSPVTTAAAAAPATAKASAGSYTVRAGDTLSAIAAAHGTSVDALFTANHATIGGNPNLILPGQTLSI
ncbi:transglycosylase family protein [Streptacidiphilus sp. EB129]|uniref:LysM peptidoglycan-binding domain-containing protein n=1 Tax=Streptacidiphilus sp. EB129 TaxID=3156262 RepID=UPI0035140B3B